MTNQAPRNPIIKPINGLEMANQSGIASRKESERSLPKRQRAGSFVFVLIIFAWLADRSIRVRRGESEQFSKPRFIRFARRTITVGLNPFWMLEAQSVVDLSLKLSVRADLPGRRKSVRFHDVKHRH